MTNPIVNTTKRGKGGMQEGACQGRFSRHECDRFLHGMQKDTQAPLDFQDKNFPSEIRTVRMTRIHSRSSQDFGRVLVILPKAAAAQRQGSRRSYEPAIEQ
jgi:hypothetical protein